MLISGGNSSDNLTGTNRADIILGGNGKDTLSGGDGSDLLDGGNGNDSINGGSGSDLLLGENGNDTLNGGSGSDIVLAGNGDDVVIHVVAENGGSCDAYSGGAGRDTLRLVVTSAVYASAAFQADIAAFQAKLTTGSATHYFDSLNVLATSFEKLEIVVSGGGNQAPTNVLLSNNSVAENAAGAVVGLLSAVDPDSNATAFTLVSGADKFEISGNELRLKSNVSLDHELAATQTIIVRVTDAGGLFFDKSLTVSVTNVNEAPTGIALSASTVSENDAGAVIGLLSTTDPDAGDAHSYTVSDARFEIAGNALRLKSGIALDHEAEPSISIDVISSDAGGLTRTQSFDLTVTNVNEVPTAIALTGTSVSENDAGAVIGLLSTTDPDAGDTHSYTVSDARFEIAGNALRLKSGIALDHEAEPSISIDVISSDAGGLTRTQSFDLTVTNVNEVPTAIALTGTSVSENDAGAVIGTLSTTDPDAGDTHSYTVSDARFEIAGNALRLKSGIALDHEAEPLISIDVTSTDASGLSRTQSFELSVTNVNEAPTGITLSALSVGEARAGAAIGELAVADPDLNDTATFTFDDDRFEAVGTTLKLKDGVVVDFTSEPEITVTVTATDAAGANTSQSFTITVLDAQEGVAVDGYIAGATVFADADGDGQLDAGEAHTVTDASGNFSLLGGTGQIVLFGGTDISTGLPFQTILKAPSGSTVVTPLTTLVVAIAGASATTAEVAAASAVVLSGLGLDPTTDLGAFDPIAAALSDDPAQQAIGQAAIAAAVQLQNTIAQASALLSGTGGTTAEEASNAILNEIAGSLQTQVAIGQTLDLGDATAIEGVITAAGVAVLADPSAIDAVVAGAATVVAASNGAASEALEAAIISGDSTALLTSLAQISQVAQNETSDALSDAGQEGTSEAITQVESAYSGAALDAAIAAAPVGDVDGANSGDAIEGTGLADLLFGYGGNNSITGLAGNDTLDGGDGDDTLDGGSGFNILRGGAGNDTLIQSPTVSPSDGGRAEYTGATGPISVAMGVAGATTGTVTGDASVGTDTLDRVEWVVGTSFADTFAAGTTFISGDGSRFNEFSGGGGNDTITGNGETRVGYHNAAAGVEVDLATGVGQSRDPGDTAQVGVDSFSGVSQVRGSSFDDMLLGSNGAQFEGFRGQGGNDTIDGRGGIQDRADYRNSPNGIVAAMGGSGTGTGTVADGYGGTDTLVNIEWIRGSEFADQITMDDGNNRVQGQAGNDLVFGMGGNDTLEGGDGNDTLDGGTGTTTAIGGAGDDLIIGYTGPGLNVFQDSTVVDYRSSTGAVTGSIGAVATVTGNASVGTDTVQYVDRIFTSNFADVITVTSDYIYSDGSHFIEIDGAGGNDTITGNGETRVGYGSANGGVQVDLGLGTASGYGGGGSAAATNIGTDTLVLGMGPGGQNGIVQIRGSNFADRLIGSDGAWFESFRAQGGNDFIDGRGGTADRADYRNSSSGINANLQTGVVLDGFGTTDTVTNIEWIRGSQFGDVITGDGANNRFEGETGDDTMTGGGGNDELRGDAGTGDTAIYSGQRFNYDVTDNGNGTYTIVHARGTQADGTDTVRDVEFFQFADGVQNLADLLAGNPTNTAPSDIQLSNGFIQENAPGGAVVGVLTATDPTIGDTPTFTLLDDAGGRFQIFNGGPFGWQIVVASGASLDFETATSHDVTVRVTDAFGATYDEVFTIAVTDIDETVNVAPTALALIGDVVEENTAPGTLVGIVSATDANAGDVVTYTLDDDAGGRFEIVNGPNNSAELRVAAAGPNLDYETATSHTLTIRATDQGGLFTTLIVPIQISNVSGTVIGDGDGNYLPGTSEEDLVQGQGGDDLLVGLEGADTLDGGPNGAFVDTADYRSSPNGIVVDLTIGTAQDGYGFTDQLISIEAITDSSFADSISGDGNQNWFRLSGGTDTVDGAGGFDSVFYEDAPSGVTVNLVTGVATDGGGNSDTLLNIEAVHGSNFADTITLNDGSSYVFGRGGADQLFALGGNDRLHPGSGNDTVDGGNGIDTLVYSETDGTDSGGPITQGAHVNLATGTATDPWGGTDTLTSIEAVEGSALNDTLIGSAGDNTLDGGDGDDTLDGGSGFNILRGGAGNDTLIQSPTVSPSDGGRAEYTGATGPISVAMGVAGATTGTVTGDASVGTDTLDRVEWVVGTSFADTFAAGTTFISGDGSRFNEFSGGGGNDTITGNGETRVGYHNAAAGVEVDLATGVGQSRDPGDTAQVGVDSFSGVSQVRGSSFDDMLLGSNGAQLEGFRGQGGNDTIDGRGGIQDRADYRNSPNGIVAAMGGSGTGTGTVADGYGGTDTLVNIEWIRGSEFADQITMDDGNNRVQGQAGNDLVFGMGGNDTLEGGDGNDTLDGGTGTTTAIGGAGDDLIIGYTGPGLNVFQDSTVVDYRSSTGAVTGSIGAVATVTGNASVGTDTVQYVDRIFTSNFADVITVTSDYIYSDGSHFIEIDGAGGNDTITGNGETRVGYGSANGGVQVDLGLGTASGYGGGGSAAATNIGTDTLVLGMGPGGQNGIVQIRGSNFADRLIGSDGAWFESFRAQGGNDFIDGRGGTADRADYRNSSSGINANLQTGVVLDGFGTTDTVTNIEWIRGSQSGDVITGDGGNNRFEGETGDDTMTGGGGNDTMIGGRDADLLSGGSGADLFVFADGFGSDVISDFSGSLGGDFDVLDLRGATGITDFASVQSTLTEDVSGVILTLGTGDTLRLDGKAIADLQAEDFLYWQA